MNGLAICAGVGGIELGLSVVVPEYRTVCYIEREAYAAAVLVARMADTSLDCAPVWDDVRTFDGIPWRDIVDMVSTGFPCQPWSIAGKRQGASDTERYLWPDIRRIIGEIEPTRVFIENVPNIVPYGGLDTILRDLCVLGFDAEWDTFSASQVGAPQRRERLFVLGHASSDGRREGRAEPSVQRGRDTITITDSKVGNADFEGLQGRNVAILERRDERAFRTAGTTVGVGLFPYGPQGHDDEWRSILERRPDLAPATEPELRGVADGHALRVDRLHALGNGVVPLVAAYAYLTLEARF